MVGLALGAVLGRLDPGAPGPWSFVVYEGDAEAARSFVSLAATALATITTLTLTLTVVSLQLASSRYSPRLIEHYLDDRVTHAVFSLFLGTISFSIATLLNVRLPSEAHVAGRVPGVAVAVLVILLTVCLGALVFFVHRVTATMRVEAILRRVRDRTVDAAMRRRDGGDEDDPEQLPDPPAGGRAIRSRRSGYYAALDRDAIDRFDPDTPCRVWIVTAPGDFVTEGTPVAIVADVVDDETAGTIESWLRFDAERWIEEDVGYGVRNLVDVVLTGVSPGVNDPTTSTMAIERLGEAFAAAGRRHPERAIRTESGTEVYVAIREWDEMVTETVRQISEYGRHDVAVVTALIRMLARLAWADSVVDRRPALGRVAGHLRSWLALDVVRSSWDDELIADEFDLLDRALSGEMVAHRRHPL